MRGGKTERAVVVSAVTQTPLAASGSPPTVTVTLPNG